MLIVVVAILVCVFVVSAFWFANTHKVDPVWIFLAWNSILMVPLFVKNFGRQVKRPAFVGFLALWMFAHGVIVVSLMRWVPYAYWIPVFILELYAGYLASYWLFGVLPSSKL
jgi:hypothetical protein